MAISAILAITFATSATGSRLPSPTSSGEKYTGLAPSFSAPIQKDNFVRSEGFSNIRATEFPFNARLSAPLFSSIARYNNGEISAGGRSRNFKKCLFISDVLGSSATQKSKAQQYLNCATRGSRCDSRRTGETSPLSLEP